MNAPRSTSRPLVYSCSGCSNLAQLANQVAVHLDRTGQAEMSCIAGVGGGVPTLVNKARSGRTIIALDGCPLHCVKHCLEKQAIHPSSHITLTELGFRKRQHEDCNGDDLERVLKWITPLLSPPDTPA